MSDQDSSAVVIRFVLPKGKNEATCSDELSEAFGKCQEQDMNPTWITTNEALAINPGKTDVFVLDPFEGKRRKKIKLSFGGNVVFLFV